MQCNCLKYNYLIFRTPHKLLVDHYDLSNGTQFYRCNTYVPYGSKQDTIATTLIENASTGFTYFYERPANQISSYTKNLQPIQNFKVSLPSGSNTATIAFDCPPAIDANGDSIEFNSWSYKKLRLTFSSTNGYPTISGIDSQLDYGEHCEGTVELPEGLSTLTVKLSSVDGDLGLAPVLASTTVVAGYDAPDVVGDPTLTISGQKATVSWTAPTKGRYDDFGATYDGSDLTYKVVRNDGFVVDSTLTVTTVTDDSLSARMENYTYSIYAYSHGKSSVGARTNSAEGGIYEGLPYTNTFDDKSSLDGWTVINANNDGSYCQWRWSSYTKNVYMAYRQGDDWLITPSFSLSSDSLYELSYLVKGAGNLRTTYGKGATVAAQSNILDEITATSILSKTTYSTTYGTDEKDLYVHPESSGTYNFGFYDYNATTDYNWMIDSVVVKVLASVNAPDSVNNVSFSPAANGALTGTFSFNLPTTNMQGKNLSSLSSVTVYDRAGNVLNTNSDVSPGIKSSLQVTAAKGWNTYKIVAVNSNGEGFPVLKKVYVGPDIPQAVANFKAKWGDEINIADLSWNKVSSVGVNGGYVDTTAVTYKIYKYDSSSWPNYTELSEVNSLTEAEVQIVDASTAQNQYIFGITANTTAGESDYTRVGIIMGKAYDLPMTEPFAKAGISHAPWLLISGVNDQTWALDEGHYDLNIQPENSDSLQLVLPNTGTGNGSATFASPIIDFTNAKSPKFYVWVNQAQGMPSGTYVTVDATIDGSDYIAVADTQSISGNNGWTEHVFDLSKLVGHKAQVGLTGYLPNPQARIFADNWDIREANGKDLAISGISQPLSAVVGDTLDIAVTVTNRGAQAATGYSVEFTVDNDVIDEVDPEESLVSGATKIVNFKLPVTAARHDLIYSAEVIDEGDEDETNNTSTEVEVDAKQLNLPAPSNLSVSQSLLTWDAPEPLEGYRDTLDFENDPSFLNDSIEGWNTYDGDGNLTLTFPQYYGNTWPYFNQPLAWMVWDAADAGVTADIWSPQDGNKCLIAWGNYGEDADGRTSTKADDDWFISPEIKGGSDFSFVTSANASSCILEVLTSSSDRNPASFTNKVTTVTYPSVQTSTWYPISCTLPADAKYVALHVATNGFGILVDDIDYVRANATKLLGYKVYYGDDVTNFVTTTTTTAPKLGDYAVSAVYNLGESLRTSTVSTGIHDVSTQDVIVRGGKGQIVVSGAAGLGVMVYSTTGQEEESGIVSAEQIYRVPAGVYLVKVAERTYKVVVK